MLFKQGKDKGAEEKFEEAVLAVENNDNFSIIRKEMMYMELGNYLLLKGKQVEAANFYRKGFDIWAKTQFLYKNRRESELLALVKLKKLTGRQDYVISQYMFGVIFLRQQGQQEKAEYYSNRLLEISKSEPIVHFLSENLLDVSFKYYTGIITAFYREISINIATTSRSEITAESSEDQEDDKLVPITLNVYNSGNETSNPNLIRWRMDQQHNFSDLGTIDTISLAYQSSRVTSFTYSTTTRTS